MQDARLSEPRTSPGADPELSKIGAEIVVNETSEDQEHQFETDGNTTVSSITTAERERQRQRIIDMYLSADALDENYLDYLCANNANRATVISLDPTLPTVTGVLVDGSRTTSVVGSDRLGSITEFPSEDKSKCSVTLQCKVWVVFCFLIFLVIAVVLTVFLTRSISVKNSEIKTEMTDVEMTPFFLDISFELAPQSSIAPLESVTNSHLSGFLQPRLTGFQGMTLELLNQAIPTRALNLNLDRQLQPTERKIYLFEGQVQVEIKFGSNIDWIVDVLDIAVYQSFSSSNLDQFVQNLMNEGILVSSIKVQDKFGSVVGALSSTQDLTGFPSKAYTTVRPSYIPSRKQTNAPSSVPTSLDDTFIPSTSPSSRMQSYFPSQVPTNNPTTVLSTSFPSLIPSIKPSISASPTICTDTTDIFEIIDPATGDNMDANCQYLGLIKYNFNCLNPKYKTLCPVTCNECPYHTPYPTMIRTHSPSDCFDSEHVFEFLGQPRTCKYVKNNLEKPNGWKKICDQAIPKMNCPKTCDDCPKLGLEPSYAPADRTSHIPSDNSSEKPTHMPSEHPSEKPTHMPSEHLSEKPTDIPNNNPNEKPTYTPNEHPSEKPTHIPSDNPSEKSTHMPSCHPSEKPTHMPSDHPSEKPTNMPNDNPSEKPTHMPSEHPSEKPTHMPNDHPSEKPTHMPSEYPNEKPTYMPSEHPSKKPTYMPSEHPSEKPTYMPNDHPSEKPTYMPSEHPSEKSTYMPSEHPSEKPTHMPSEHPSEKPTYMPSDYPSEKPTHIPSDYPSEKPTHMPSGHPSEKPTNTPTKMVIDDYNIKIAVEEWLFDNTAAEIKFGHISVWDVSRVTSMRELFVQDFDWLDDDRYYYYDKNSRFNEDLSMWNVSSVTDMSRMFQYATEFDQNLSEWDTSSVTDMSHMFMGAKKFNQPLGNWDVSSVKTTREMFSRAKDFNQDLGSWDVSSIDDFSLMFFLAVVFGQNMCWDIKEDAKTFSMFQGTNKASNTVVNDTVGPVWINNGLKFQDCDFVSKRKKPYCTWERIQSKCPKTCGICIEPDEPPSPAPVKMPTTPRDCSDSMDTFFLWIDENTQGQKDCDFVASDTNKFCIRERISELCPVTCDSCPCVDIVGKLWIDETFQFKGCEFVKLNSRFCTWQRIAKECPVTCNLCPEIR